MRRHRPAVLTAAVALFVVSAGTSTIQAQGVFGRIKKAAEDAAKRVEETTKKADDAAKKAEEARKAAEALAKAREGDKSAGTATSPPSAPEAAARSAAPAGVEPVKGVESSAKVDVEIMMPVEPGQHVEYHLSPKGNHVVAVVPRGSRYVVMHDGVASQPFDEVMDDTIEFSDDGARYGYIARLGTEFVYMVDGKELVRLPGSEMRLSTEPLGESRPLFTAHGRHVYFIPGPTSRPRTFFFDGRAIAQIEGAPSFSPDGERYAFFQRDAVRGGRGPLVVDGKPTTWPSGDPQFTGDSKHLITAAHINMGGTEVFMDGKPWFRITNANLLGLFAAPVTDLVVATFTPNTPGRTGGSFLVVNGKRVDVGPDVTGFGRVRFSPDGRHWAVVAEMAGGSQVVVVDGKKGLDYQGTDDLRLLPDGRPVYHATSRSQGSAREFVVIGDQESNAYTSVTQGLDNWVRSRIDFLLAPEGQPQRLVIVGNHVMFMGYRNAGPNNIVVVHDGKEMPVTTQGGLVPSADGSRVAFVTEKTVFVDGVLQQGPERGRGQRAFTFSDDGRQLAYASINTAVRDQRTGMAQVGIMLNGRHIPLALTTPTLNASFDYLTFSPDGRHLYWVMRATKERRTTVYADGLPVLEVDDQLAMSPQNIDGRWSVSEDGVLTVVAIEGNALKRFRITPGSHMSIEAMAKMQVMP